MYSKCLCSLSSAICHPSANHDHRTHLYVAVHQCLISKVTGWVCLRVSVLSFCSQPYQSHLWGSSLSSAREWRSIIESAGQTHTTIHCCFRLRTEREWMSVWVCVLHREKQCTQSSKLIGKKCPVAPPPENHLSCRVTFTLHVIRWLASLQPLMLMRRRQKSHQNHHHHHWCWPDTKKD